jgi:hypothetical protein
MSKNPIKFIDYCEKRLGMAFIDKIIKIIYNCFIVGKSDI